MRISFSKPLIASALSLFVLFAVPSAQGATFVAPGQEQNSIVVAIEGTESTMIEENELLLFQENSSGRLFSGTVLRVGGTKAIVAIAIPVTDLTVGAKLRVWPPYRNQFPSPILREPGFLHSTRNSSLSFPLGFTSRTFSPQSEDPARYQGYSFGVRPEWNCPEPRLLLGGLVHYETLKQSTSPSFPTNVTRTAFEPHAMVDVGSAVSLGAKTRYWLIRHSDVAGDATTHYDYNMVLFDFNLVLHGKSGELGVSYGTGSKILPKTTTTVPAVKGAVITNSRFLIAPPTFGIQSRLILGGGLSVLASAGKVLVSDSLYEKSDLIENSTAADMMFYRFGGEVLTGGASKFELFAKREDPFSLRAGGQPRYVSTFGVESVVTLRVGSLLDLSFMVDGASGSRLFKYAGTTEQQSFEVQEWTATVAMSWILAARE